MAAMRARDVYDEFVKRLPKAERLKLLAILAEETARQSGEAAANITSILDLHGLGKEIRQGTDAQEYVNELRQEWEQRP